MAWTYDQDFNALSDGDLGGQDSWTGVGGTKPLYVSTTAACRYEGAKGLTSGISGGQVGRTVTNTTTGTVWYAMKYSTTSASGDGLICSLMQTGNYGSIVKISQVAGTTKLQYYTGAAYAVLISPMVQDQWYVVAITYNTASGGNGSYDIAVDGTTLVTGATMYQNVASGLNRIELGSDLGSWVPDYDTISSTNIIAAGPTTVKTFDGVTQSSGIKTYFGTALASTKTLDGLT